MVEHQFAKHSSIRTVLLTSLLFCVRDSLVPAQTQQKPAEPAKQDQAIKLKTELVELRAVVTGRKGELILDLKQSDFELRDNGKPREISFFSVETSGGGTKPGATGTADRPASERSGPRPIDQSLRSVVLFVDTLHLASDSLLRTKQELKKFVREQLSPDDVVAVVATGGGGGLAGQFTRDRQAIGYAIDRL
ncbi:MAG TPA: VWA domain-containing protein, partial [Blastocatellia bacterium]|nr:VWA domain-containing protein [Blastocatellia bacterium]